MSYFWVNQGGTYRDEVQMGCLWAPQFDASGNKLSHWESMDLLKVGDIVFNYAKGKLCGYAIVLSQAIPGSRPYNSGTDYSPSQGGRFVFCDYIQLASKLTIPLANLLILPGLSKEISSGTNPVMSSNKKICQKYLCQISSLAGSMLMSELQKLGLNVTSTNRKILAPSKTTIKQLIDARLGQGKFKADLVKAFNGVCAITSIGKSGLLRASHIKAWSVSDNKERLDPENGLLLVAGIDAAFDKGLISFDTKGNLLSKLTPAEEIAIGIPNNASLVSACLTPSRLNYLANHRIKFKF